MKLELSILLFLIIQISIFGQGSNQENELRTNLQVTYDLLIGTWEITKVIDSDGNKVERIQKEAPKNTPPGFPGVKDGKIQIKASGPTLIFNPDLTYEKIFSEKNRDSGNWKLISENEIEYELVTEKGSSSYNMLKTAAEMFGKNIEFDENGNIVEKVTDKIIRFEGNELEIQYEDIYVLIYKKQ